MNQQSYEQIVVGRMIRMVRMVNKAVVRRIQAM